jgi:hypothetical protein
MLGTSGGQLKRQFSRSPVRPRRDGPSGFATHRRLSHRCDRRRHGKSFEESFITRARRPGEDRGVGWRPDRRRLQAPRADDSSPLIADISEFTMPLCPCGEGSGRMTPAESAKAGASPTHRSSASRANAAACCPGNHRATPGPACVVSFVMFRGPSTRGLQIPGGGRGLAWPDTTPLARPLPRQGIPRRAGDFPGGSLAAGGAFRCRTRRAISS